MAPSKVIRLTYAGRRQKLTFVDFSLELAFEIRLHGHTTSTGVEAQEVVEDFLESGERLWSRFKKLLNGCEVVYTYRAHTQPPPSPQETLSTGLNTELSTFVPRTLHVDAVTNTWEFSHVGKRRNYEIRIQTFHTIRPVIHLICVAQLPKASFSTIEYQWIHGYIHGLHSWGLH